MNIKHKLNDKLQTCLHTMADALGMVVNRLPLRTRKWALLTVGLSVGLICGLLVIGVFDTNTTVFHRDTILRTLDIHPLQVDSVNLIPSVRWDSLLYPRIIH